MPNEKIKASADIQIEGNIPAEKQMLLTDNTQISSQKEEVNNIEEKNIINEEAEKQKAIEALHNELFPKYEWVNVFNKDLASVHIEYNNTNMTIPSKSFKLLRKDLIQNVPKNANLTYKKA